MAPPARGVFISYRRSDAGPYARLLQVRLGQFLPGTPVFMDLDSIEAGTDFAEAIKAALESCRVLIALIGPRWLTVSDAEGRPRLDDPDDYVRFEIRTALEKAKAGTLTRTLVGLEMTERGIARDGYKVLDGGGREIGYITSGSPAPFLKKNIALAYVPPEFAAVGTVLKVEVRGQGVGAQVVPTPFYRRPKKNL